MSHILLGRLAPLLGLSLALGLSATASAQPNELGYQPQVEVPFIRTLEVPTIKVTEIDPAERYRSLTQIKRIKEFDPSIFTRKEFLPGHGDGKIQIGKLPAFRPLGPLRTLRPLRPLRTPGRPGLAPSKGCPWGFLRLGR